MRVEFSRSKSQVSDMIRQLLIISSLNPLYFKCQMCKVLLLSKSCFKIWGELCPFVSAYSHLCVYLKSILCLYK